jgi:hypothetical protein
MQYLCVILLSAACAGCQSGALKAPAAGRSNFHPFPDIPPIADADPSRRHSVATRVPTELQLVRNEHTLIYRLAALHCTNLMVGYKMVVGVECEGSMHCGGTERPLFRRLTSAPALDNSTNIFTLKSEKGIPKTEEDCVFEYRITIFETDLPSQHMWSPKSGKHYRVLWTHTFREAVR